MDLTGIFTIGGKPGLQKLVAQSSNGVIVESLLDGKRFNAYSSYKISSLEDITIYGEVDDIPLKEVFSAIGKANNFGKLEVPAKSELKSTLSTYVPADSERVYESDIKKLFSWYNLLIESKILTVESSEEKEADKIP